MKRHPLRTGAMPLIVVATMLAPALAADAPPDEAARQALFQGLNLSISSTPPTDIPGGAGSAGLVDASAFAWQEFIALNWPALQQNGQVVRDKPDPQAVFGSPGSGPLVWETFRHKVEIFPGSNSPSDPPHGYNSGTQGDPHGYSAPPVYVYSPTIYPNGGQVGACPGQPAVAQAPWINLDETSEIGLTDMYAGVLSNVAPSTSNSAPTQFRYLAKANSAEYNYVVNQNLWYAGPNTPLQARIDAWTAGISAGVPADPGSVVTLPAGTIEVKSAWRMLAPGEDATRYHTNTVRYYEADASGVPCYWQAEWALAALHIIQKTPSAPYFVFATFEQADNIVQPDGTPIENAAGAMVQQPVWATPTTPYLFYQDRANNPIVGTNDAYCTNIGSRLYYHEIPAAGDFQGTPVGGNICVNKRYEPIPYEIQQINTIFQNQIRDYNASNGLSTSPWLNYKLVSVQAVPFNKSDIVTTFNSTRQRGSYYQANIVVETDYTLQQFSGRIADDNAPTDYPKPDSQPETKNGYQPNFQNVYLPEGNSFKTYQMGGCMGCHGNAQLGGTDFSFLFGGNTLSAKPDLPDPDDAAEARAFYRARLSDLLSLPAESTAAK